MVIFGERGLLRNAEWHGDFRRNSVRSLNKNMHYEVRKLAGLIETVNLRSRAGFDSINLFNEMSTVAPAAINNLQAGLQWLVDNSLKAVIIGGTAVVHYVSGARDLTPDLDFLAADFQAVMNQLKQDNLHFSPIAERQVSRFGGGSIGVYVSDFDADFLDPAQGNPALNRYLLSTALPGRVGGVSFPIASPEALAILKLDMGRDKDDSDAFLLFQSGHVNRDKYVQAVRKLSNSLGDPESMLHYADMIQ